VQIVERVIEKVVHQHDPECLKNLEQAQRLIAAASDRLILGPNEVTAPLVLATASKLTSFPTMAEMERAMIVGAYQRSNRKPLEAARLLGIGKATLYRKLREIDLAA
jgi:transcriptional regulator of acetoin/glycerol metabolism